MLGAWRAIKQDRVLGICLSALLVVYILYFCRLNVQIVRNYLILLPALAILSARGLSEISIRLPKQLAAGLPIILLFVFGLHTLKLIQTAKTIAIASPTQLASEIQDFLKSNSTSKVFLSPKVKRLLKPRTLSSVSIDAADVLLLDLDDVENRDDWPANRHRQFLGWFGPHSINFNYYPTFPSNGQVLAIQKQQFAGLGMRIKK
jgi:hypothetical protein